MIYSQDIKNNNFCIVQIDNKPKIVADIFTNDLYENAGSFSCSWREVDIEFYQELFDILKENGKPLDWGSLG